MSSCCLFVFRLNGRSVAFQISNKLSAKGCEISKAVTALNDTKCEQLADCKTKKATQSKSCYYYHSRTTVQPLGETKKLHCLACGHCWCCLPSQATPWSDSPHNTSGELKPTDQKSCPTCWIIISICRINSSLD